MRSAVNSSAHAGAMVSRLPISPRKTARRIRWVILMGRLCVAAAISRSTDVPRATEAEPIHASLGVRSISLGGSDAWRAVHPPATAERLVGTMIRAFRISVWPIPIIVRIIPIGGPFGDIAGHVEDSVRADRVLVLIH